MSKKYQVKYEDNKGDTTVIKSPIKYPVFKHPNESPERFYGNTAPLMYIKKMSKNSLNIYLKEGSDTWNFTKVDLQQFINWLIDKEQELE